MVTEESALLAAHGPNEVNVACTWYVPGVLIGTKTVARPLFTSALLLNPLPDSVTRPFGELPSAAVTRTSKDTTPEGGGSGCGVNVIEVVTIGASSTMPS